MKLTIRQFTYSQIFTYQYSDTAIVEHKFEGLSYNFNIGNTHLKQMKIVNYTF